MSKQIKTTSKIVDRIDSQKKQMAVQLWRETYGHVTNICAAVGISRQTFYNWMEKDKDFSQAITEAEAELNDEMRRALVEQAAGGNTGAIIFYLKKRHPDFLDKPNTLVQVNSTGDMSVEFGGNEIQTP